MTLRRTLINWVKYFPKGYAYRFLQVRPALQFACFVAAYALLGITFSWAYGAADGVGSGTSNAPVQDTWDLLYFSFLTQATANFGDLSPRGPLGKSLAIIQMLLGMSLIALWLGVVVSMLIARPLALRFADLLLYDPRTHRFVFWIMNQEAVNLHIASIEVNLIMSLTPVDNRTVRLANYPILLHRRAKYLEAMQGLVIQTSSLGIQDVASPPLLGPRDPNPVTIATLATSLADTSVFLDAWFEITIAASRQGTSVESTTLRAYYPAAIVCGEYADVHVEKSYVKIWYHRQLRNFGQLAHKSNAEDCANCKAAAACPLTVGGTLGASGRAKNHA